MDRIIKIKLTDINKIYKFIDITNDYSEDVNIYYRHFVLDGKSLLCLMSCDLTKPISVKLVSDNELNLKSFRNCMRQFEVIE